MGKDDCVNRLRRALLELWAMMLVSGVVGFLGPFGSYLAGNFLTRFAQWSMMLLGSYLMIRPVILLCHWIERLTHLPRNFVVVWGTISASFPMAMIWAYSAPQQTRMIGGYSGLIPFALLNAWLVGVVVWWAERSDAHLRHYYSEIMPHRAQRDTITAPIAASTQGSADTAQPRLHQRLSRSFTGPVLALESEDHYVRVHGERQSELLLMRLRDAIAEMDECPGEQTHRSWWVRADSVDQAIAQGRNRELRLVNGLRVPVARDSIARLTQSGFIKT